MGPPPVYCAAVATGYNSYLKTSAANEKHLRGSIPPGGNGMGLYVCTDFCVL